MSYPGYLSIPPWWYTYMPRGVQHTYKFSFFPKHDCTKKSKVMQCEDIFKIQVLEMQSLTFWEFVGAPPRAFRRRASILMLFIRQCIPAMFNTQLSNLTGTTTNIGFYQQKKFKFFFGDRFGAFFIIKFRIVLPHEEEETKKNN